MVARFSGDVRLNLMAKEDYRLQETADGSRQIYVLDQPMMNETGSALVYPFGFEPTLHRYRLDTLGKLKMGNNIFVGAMADVFGAWVPDEWIQEVLSTCQKYPIHNFLFLTKNPGRYMQYGVPTGQDNLWYGTTITCDADAARVGSLTMDAKTFVSIEPLMESISKGNIAAICSIVDWVIIGAETGRSKNKTLPQEGWVRDIVAEADRAGKPVFMKDSLIPIIGEENMRRDFPEQLQHSELSPKMKDKLYDVCAECRAGLMKSDMVALLARSRRGESAKQFGFMCKDCFKKFCKDLGLDIPELAELAESIVIGSGDHDG